MTSRNDTRFAYNRHTAAQLPNSNENAGNDTTAAGSGAPLAPVPIKSLAPAAGPATRAGAQKIHAPPKPKPAAVPTRATRAAAAAAAANAAAPPAASAAAVPTNANANANANEHGPAGIKRTASRQPKIMSRQEQQLAQKHEVKVAPVPVKAGYYESIAEEVVVAPASKARKTTKMETARVAKSAAAAKQAARVDSASEAQADEQQQDVESPRSKRLRLCEEVAREMGVDQIVARNPRTGRLCLIEDPDEEDIHDPAMCGEYAQEILDYLVTREKIFQPKAYYVTQQGDMSWGMRSVLVDWLFEVHKKFEFLPETMFLAVSLLDRFMSLRQCDIGKFQLVGLTCLFIAAKIEEVNPPQIGTLVYMADNGFAEADMIAAESYILKTLDFDLWAPGPFSFIRRISKADEYDLHNRNLTKYLVEVALMDHRFLAYPMSQIAAGAFFVARAANVFQTSSKTKTVTMAAGEYAAEALEWGVYFVQSSGYCRKELVPIVALFNDFFNVKVPQSVNEWAFFTSKLTHSKRYRDLDLRINAVVAALKLEKECDAVVKQHAEMDAEAMQEARLGAQAAEIKATGGVAPALPNGGRLGVWKPLPVAQIE